MARIGRLGRWRRVRVRDRRWPFVGWLVVTTIGFLLCVSSWVDGGVAGGVVGRVVGRIPDWAPTSGAVVITTTYATALAARTGGRRLYSGLIAFVLAGVAVAWGEALLLSGVALGTAVLAAVLGVMATTPGARYRVVTREVVVSAAVAVVGAFGVEAYEAPVSLDRAAYAALGAALLGAVGLVYRLGAGFHGLGRRGAVAVLAGIVLLFVGLAYTEALSRWGTGELTRPVDDLITSVHDTLGAVPRPTEFLLGFPALAWGISTRARRRQGWWVCAFGAPGLAIISTSLLDPRMSLTEAGRVLGYGLLVGLALGYGVVRADTYLTGTRGRRARRLEELAAHRPEPRRYEALL